MAGEHRRRADGPPAGGFRGDVEGLRGIAVLVVVLYHAGGSVFGGGYVGVDVFFVLSGYLITGLLSAEVARVGRVSFLSFYARRARRILPAASVVLVATVVCAVGWLPPLQARGVTKDAVASALFVSNYRFAAVGTNYLAANGLPSPLQHFWSLAVEEQFYLFWPAAVAGAVLLARRWGRRSVWMVIVLGVVTIASFGYGLRLTGVNPPWAYFGLPSRGWELGAGGLLFLGTPALRRIPAWWAGVAGWLGLVALAYAVTAMTGATPFPGLAALVPVAGTVAVIAAGARQRSGGPGGLLGVAPLRYVGRISYSWYLWHWPVLILTPALVGHQLDLPQRLGLCAASGVLAVGTLHLVENPIRYSTVLRARPRWSMAMGAALTVTGLAASLVAAGSVPPLNGRGPVAAPIALITPTPQPDSHQAGPSGARRPPSPAVAALLSADRRISALVGSAVLEQSVPSNLDPPLTSAAADKAPPFLDGCNLTWTDTQQPGCAYTAGAPEAVVFGDSHAAQWFPPLQRIAVRRHWKLTSYTKTTCPPLELSVFSPYLGRPYSECDQWRTAILARIRAEHPALVVLGVARHYSSAYHVTVYDAAWDAALAKTVRDIRADGAAVLVLGPTPKPAADVPTCLSAHFTSAASCTFAYHSGVDAAGIAGERRAVEHAHGAYLNIAPWLCTPHTCAIILGNLLLYRDDNHLTTTVTSWLTPALEPAVTAALRGTTLPN